MSSQNNLQADNKGSEERLLTSAEREALNKISTGQAPHSQRASALLAIDEGATQAAAGEQAGLTSRQVKYWLDKFRKVGLAVFPEAEVEEAPEEGAKKDKKPKKAKKARKSKKGKKKAKKKKGKGKRAKKSKKKSKKK